MLRIGYNCFNSFLVSHSLVKRTHTDAGLLQLQLTKDRAR